MRSVTIGVKAYNKKTVHKIKLYLNFANRNNFFHSFCCFLDFFHDVVVVA